MSSAIADLPGLPTLLGCPVRKWRGGSREASGEGAGEEVVLAWGHKPSATKAAAFARQHGRPLLRLEDGFLRSVDLGQKSPPLSLVLDDCGIYYDASAPSRLEQLIAREPEAGQTERAEALIAAWRRGRVSKYNHAPEYDGVLPDRYVLLADQTAGDVSITRGAASEASFHRALEAALEENPECEVVVKVHPEVFAGTKKGHFDLKTLRDRARVRVLGADVHPVRLIEGAEALYVVTSQMGFEGLIHGKRVRTFGMPFYAGWGVTEDELPRPGRRHISGEVSLERLVYAALIAYPRYIDPERGVACEAEEVLEWIALQRQMRGRFPQEVHAVGFSRWKRPILEAYLQGSRVVFHTEEAAVPPGGTVLIWGRRQVELPGREIVRVEDGFLRSVGLGADLIWPKSWIFDRSGGIYYDSTVPSDLEQILQMADFPQTLITRARALCESIRREGVTKYNVGHRRYRRPEGVARVILVPGQVESDASIRFGSPEIRSNVDLLKRVREENPEAYLIYKPHPDVEAGLRVKGEGEAEARKWCDEIVCDTAIAALFDEVDELHLLTSLAGFEALLRGKRVVCYGQPFYSGWGLTHDFYPVGRRTRRLTIEELVAATLILYPVYLNSVHRQFTTPERALEAIRNELLQSPPRRPWLGRRLLRVILKAFKGNGPKL